MKQPNSEQLRALQDVANNFKAVEYLDVLIQECLDRLVVEQDGQVIRQIQGSAGTLQELKKHITSRKR